MFDYWLALLVSIAVIAFFAFGIRRPKVNQSEWHEYMGFWSPGPIMRRWRNGKWEYRPLSGQERDDYEDATIW